MEFDLHQKEYTSDVTAFIAELRKKDPTLEARQKEGRLRLWDRDLNQAQQKEFEEAHVPQNAYVYEVKGE